MDLPGDVNREVSVVGTWIFDSNCKQDLPLTIESLNLICACSDEDKYFEISKEVFYVVRYVNPREKFKGVKK